MERQEKENLQTQAYKILVDNMEEQEKCHKMKEGLIQ